MLLILYLFINNWHRQYYSLVLASPVLLSGLGVRTNKALLMVTKVPGKPHEEESTGVKLASSLILTNLGLRI